MADHFNNKDDGVFRRPKQNKKRFDHSEEDSFKKSTSTKTYAFWTLVGLLCLLALANMILTVVIFSVLRLGQGMECMELIPNLGIVKFLGISNLGKIIKPDGKIEGFSGIPTEIKGMKGPLMLEIEDTKRRVRNAMVMEQNGTLFKGINTYKIGDIFKSEQPVFKLPNGVRNVQSFASSASRISSPISEQLVFRTDNQLKMKGSEGTKIEGKDITWTADQLVHLNSSNGSIILNSHKGIKINAERLTIFTKEDIGNHPDLQYKVCVCMPQGKLFKVPISNDYNSQSACHNIELTPNHNPCI